MTTTNKTLATSAAISQINGVHSILAGVFAGCVTRSCTSPLDVMKILFQVNHPTAHRSIHHACQQLYVSEGIRGFWKGNLAECFGFDPYAGVKFSIFDTLRSESSAANAPHMEENLHGAIADMGASLAVYPMQVVRTQLALMLRPPLLHSVAFAGFVACELDSFERHRALQTREAAPIEPPEALVCVNARQFRVNASKNRGVLHDDPVDHLIVGSWLGAIAQLVSYPFDSVKQRLEVDTTKRYTGMLDCVKQVVRGEGAMSLYRGTLPNMVRVVPYAAVMFASYEGTKEYLSASSWLVHSSRQDSVATFNDAAIFSHGGYSSMQAHVDLREFAF
ncbi:hypothetical protein H257_05245 [Aphanomyces astaci]|uniref:ADP/ATP translocase n=1 Tax=Aphanomyces astaci TaxID=112090 RepID=W4GSJ2_APHAT|nr:hypothetical protein H257_05245 [Aphanomyces astaci]ETV82680.1 hypothetical protein H257_05245 [Aphanomyces astaci]|eukprot:XP_009828349.1 hypothetical protein H257_05245 [Aphanomyces astaci]